MAHHRRWQEMYLNGVEVWCTRLFMSDYGGESAKPSLLYSPVPWLDDIHRYRQRTTHGRIESQIQTTVRHHSKDGKRTCSGGKDLKATQAYPVGFGRALFRTHMRHRMQGYAAALEFRAAAIDAANVEVVRRLMNTMPVDEWPDAGLQQMASKLDRDFDAGSSLSHL